MTTQPVALAQALAALIPGADQAATRVTVSHDYIELGYERRDSWSGSAIGLAHRLTDHLATEKDTPAAGAAFTPAAAILTGLARALREQPTGRRILDGLDELGELVVTGDGTAADITSWVTALGHLAGVDVAAPPTQYYLAHNGGILLDRYTTAAEAQRHCEAHVSRQYPPEAAVLYEWCVHDEDAAVLELDVHVDGARSSTGYAVTPLTVQVAFDPDADE